MSLTWPCWEKGPGLPGWEEAQNQSLQPMETPLERGSISATTEDSQPEVGKKNENFLGPVIRFL